MYRSPGRAGNPNTHPGLAPLPRQLQLTNAEEGETRERWYEEADTEWQSKEIR